MSGLMGIGITGIRAAQLSLLTTEHNIVNANTEGFSRQRVLQGTNISVNTGSGAIGTGVNVSNISRIHDRYLTGQVGVATSKLSELSAYYSQIEKIDSLLADPKAGLSPALQDFFAGVQDVAANPSLLSARQAMISSAQTLIGRFQSIDERVGEIAYEINGKITDAVNAVNSYAKEIAALNQRIVMSEGAYGKSANDLLDQRDQLINDLNKLVKVTAITNTDGSYNVFIGSGQQLVVGGRAMNMTATASMTDDRRIVVGLETAGSGSLELPEHLIVGGELGGLVSFRTASLDRVRSELGRVAISLAQTFNAQHALGQDLMGRANGDAGFNGDFFRLTNMQPLMLQNSKNQGSPTFSVSLLPPTYGPEAAGGNFYTNLDTSDYMLTSLDGTNYSLIRMRDSMPLLPATGGDIDAVNAVLNELGFHVDLSNDEPGNSYLIQPARYAAGNIALNPVIAADPRMIAAAVPFRTTTNEANTGTATISLGKMVGATADPFDASQLPVSLTIDATQTPSVIEFSGPGFPDGAAMPVLVKRPGQAEAEETVPLAYEQGMIISFMGMSVEFNGLPANGDRFTLERNTAATADGRNALAMGMLQTQNTMDGQRATFQLAYAEMVSANGIKTRELNITTKAQQSILEQAVNARDAMSGVNLDEEAANLIRFQQAYQASAKLIEVGKQLFDTLIQIR